MATIAELLAQQGQVLAEARRQQGAQRGALVTALGQIPAQILSDRAAERARQATLARQAEADRRAQAADERARATETRLATAETRQTAEDQRRREAAEIAQRALAEPGVLTETGINHGRGLFIAQRMSPPGLMPYVAEVFNKIKLEAPTLERVTTVDDEGREITQFVTPTPGASYLTAPKATATPTLGSFEDYARRYAAGLGTRPEALTARDLATAKAQFEAAGRAPTAPRDDPLVQVVENGVAVWRPRSQAAGQPAGGGAAGKPGTGVERRTLGFFNRLRQADGDLERIEGQIAQMGVLEQGRLQYAPNVAQSEVGQLYNQAQRAFTEARLRKDSGAAIPAPEIESDRRTYFVQPGDTAAVIAQKRRARAGLAASMAAESGRALGEFYGDEAEGLLHEFKTRSAPPATAAPPAPPGWRYVPKAGGGWTAVEDP